MLEINPKKIMAITRKEFMDNVRNRWSLALTFIFILLTLVISYFGATQGGGTVGFQGFEDTVAGMTSITAFLLPLIAIMQGYGAIIGERENGSLGVVLGCPVSRFDVIIGKFLGLGSVMFVTIFAGFGIAGLVVAALSTGTDWIIYLGFILSTFIFTMVYLGFSIMMSTLASKRSTSIAGSIFLFFSGMILSIVMIGVWTATSGNSLTDFLNGNVASFPGWFWVLEHVNFMDIYPLGSMMLFNVTQIMGFTISTPGWVSVYSIFGFQFLVALGCFILSMFIMNRKDI